jgi:steroid 5-alpha reductase family enzyme
MFKQCYDEDMNLGGILFALAFATFGYMTLWFVVARLTNRADVVDTAWGLGFVYLTWLAWRLDGSETGIPLLISVFVTVWGLRLAAHILTRNIGKAEDHRYAAYRRKWKDLFWPHTYTRIFLLQGVLLLCITSTAVAGIIADEKTFVPLAVLGFAVWAIGIICEAVADYQLRQFVKTKKPGRIMQNGLWCYSRHPNYFGEVASWWGAALVGLSLQQWWAVIGALVITLLITKISGIPLLEKHYQDNKEFQKYKKHTSVLIPLPRR